MEISDSVCGFPSGIMILFAFYRLLLFGDGQMFIRLLYYKRESCGLM